MFKKISESNSRIWLLEDLCNIVVSVCAKFEECAAKTVGGVGFLMKAYFSLPQCCQFLAHGYQNWQFDSKFKMGGCIGTILICVKFGDDAIRLFRFQFYWGCSTLNCVKEFQLWRFHSWKIWPAWNFKKRWNFQNKN